MFRMLRNNLAYNILWQTAINDSKNEAYTDPNMKGNKFVKFYKAFY